MLNTPEEVAATCFKTTYLMNRHAGYLLFLWSWGELQQLKLLLRFCLCILKKQVVFISLREQGFIRLPSVWRSDIVHFSNWLTPFQCKGFHSFLSCLNFFQKLVLNLAHVELSHRSNCTTAALLCKKEDLKYQLCKSNVVSANVNATVVLCICGGLFSSLLFSSLSRKLT